MSRQQTADKSEKSLAEILIVVIILGICMAVFIFYFFKHQAQLSRAGFDSVASVFAARVTGIHAQWFMDHQPHYVVIGSQVSDSSGKKKLRVPVNKAGWVDVTGSDLPCQRIWQYVLESPMVYMREPVAAIVVEKQGQHYTRRCQYVLPSGAYFTYQSDNGKVSHVFAGN